MKAKKKGTATKKRTTTPKKASRKISKKDLKKIKGGVTPLQLWPVKHY